MLSNHPNCLGGNGPSASSDLIGDVDGPASATDNAVARFDGTTGKLIQNSTVTIDDSGNITPSGSVHGANGAVGNPSFAFNSDQNTGLYRIGADNIGVAANGAKVLDIATTGLTVTGALGASSLTAPASTNLTLAGGSSGPSLLLGNGSSSGATLTTTGSGTLSFVFGAGGGCTFNGASSLNVMGVRAETDGNMYVRPYSTINGSGNGIAIDSLNNGLSALAGFYIRGSAIKLGGGVVSVTDTTAGSSGAGALVVAGGISAGNTGSAASYFGGDVTVSKATPVVALTNTSASTTAQFQAQSTVNRSIFIGQYGDSSAGTTLGIANAAGAFIATATTGVNYPDKLVISTLGRAAPIYFGTNNTLALTLDGTTQAATFAGAVTAGGATSGVITPQLTSQAYYQAGLLLTNTKTDNAGVRNWAITTVNDTYGDFAIKQSTTLGGSAVAGTAWMKISETGAATFAGAVTVGGNIVGSGTANTFAGGNGSILLGSAFGQNLVSLNNSTSATAMIGVFGGGVADTNMYYAAPTGGTHDMRINNASKFTLSATTATFAVAVASTSGTAAAPSYAFSSDLDTGIYNPAGNQLAAACGGGQIWNTTSNGFSMASGKDIYLGNAYVGTPVVSTGYVTIKDSNGTAYKVLVAT